MIGLGLQVEQGGYDLGIRILDCLLGQCVKCVSFSLFLITSGKRIDSVMEEKTNSVLVEMRSTCACVKTETTI